MRLFTLVLVFFSVTSLSALAPGDDLAGFWKSNAKKYTASRFLAPLSGWPGYETAVMATDEGFTKAPFVLVLRKTGGAPLVPFGTVEGPSVLVVDSDGDGTADLTTQKNVVPGWVPFRVPGPRGDGRAFRAIADRIYRQYNQEGGPVPAQLSLLVEELRKRSTDGQDADRDLSAALEFYLEQGASGSPFGTGTLAALGVALKGRGQASPLVFLFLGEALESGGLNDEAQAAYQRLIDLDPKSVIGAYKRARVDPSALAAFRKAHPDFWASRE
jgi:tetratricopeptide (TPR) repeat protein